MYMSSIDEYKSKHVFGHNLSSATSGKWAYFESIASKTSNQRRITEGLLEADGLQTWIGSKDRPNSNAFRLL